MEDCPDPLAVVSPESSNHRMISSVTPRIIKSIGAPATGQAKNAEKKDEVVSIIPCRLKVIQNKACQSVKVSPESTTPTLSKDLLSKKEWDTIMNCPSSVAAQVYLRKIRKCEREPLSITDQKKTLQTEVHLSPKSGVPRNTSLQRLVKCNYCDYQTERPAMMRSHFKTDHRKLHKVACHKVGLGYTVEYVERNNKNEHNEILNYDPIKPNKKLTSVTDHLSNKTRIYCCKLCDFATKHLPNIRIHFNRLHKLIESRSEGDLYEYQRDNKPSIFMLPPGDPGFKMINEHGEILNYVPRKRKDGTCVARNQTIDRKLKRYDMSPVEYIDEPKEKASIEDQALTNNVKEENQKSCEDDLIIKSEEIIKEEPLDDLISIVKEEPLEELKSTSDDEEYLLEAELMEEEPDPLSMDQSPVESRDTLSDDGYRLKKYQESTNKVQEKSPSRSSSPSRDSAYDLIVSESVKHNAIYLWEFFLELLERPEFYQKEIVWVDKEEGVFRIVDTKGVARLWGRHKNKPRMTFDTMGRSIQYYLQNGTFVKIEKRLTYQFADTIRRCSR